MAEIKNSFLKSKMNKDLDARLVPNGEYRDALNISVGRSEGDDVGALENILGNSIVESESGLKAIGQYFDNTNNRIFVFLTNYEDLSPLQLTPAPSNKICKIKVKDFNGAQPYSTLVEGSFLNFSLGKDFMIHSVNLIENQLFWTDNRNQPRKINVDLALNNSSHYQYEWQISVAKYSPILPLSLVKIVKAQADGGGNPQTGATIRINNAYNIGVNTKIEPGMTLIANNYNSCNFVEVVSVDYTNANTPDITLNQSVTVADEEVLTFLSSTMTDKSEDVNWPGDPDYLESRYVRFSFRFKYEDDEYSAFAPFSQIAFIPKQKGYFIDGDETDAFRSTVIRWFENMVNNIVLLIPLPAKGSEIQEYYKISKVDILYKESDSRVVKILETVDVSTIASASATDNYYSYNYQSKKPYRSLSESQTTRVYDKIPVRALTQEVSGNRVMYGNYFEGWTPPSSINYKLTFQEKGDAFDNFIEYPNHTVKENRNYQVGVVLADKYNRQSAVILSSLDTISTTSTTKGSTIFAPYSTADNPVNVKCFNGNALRMLVESTINPVRDIPSGSPGVYAELKKGGFKIGSSSPGVSGNTAEFYLATATEAGMPATSEYLRGQFRDYVKVTSVTGPTGVNNSLTVQCDGDINLKYNPNLELSSGVDDVKYAFNLNPIGWYSYKVVVRQQEQDYYNAFLPGMLKGYPLQQTFGSTTNYTTVVPSGATNAVVEPSIQHGVNTTDFPVGEENKTAHIVLINDNINKIPRDLTEVGPDQTQYRSSAELYGRVENFESTCELTQATGYEEPQGTLLANYIEYDLTNASLPACISKLRPGDGVEASAGGNTSGSITYPDDWYKNTVITSIDPDYSLNTTGSPNSNYTAVTQITLDAQNATLYDWFTIEGSGVITVTHQGDTIASDGTTEVTVSNVSNANPTVVDFNVNVDVLDLDVLTFTRPMNKGRIYFRPGQTIYSSNTGGTSMEWTFYMEENRQYYPTRKADIVSTIADSKTLGFLPNDLDNVRGTSSLNFYNLETNPLIGRVSTTQPIGVRGNTMVPFLSIYETAPDESALEVFWETTSTGLISDLNEDVLTGFDGLVGFSTLNYTHKEDQNPTGAGTTTGASDSKWVTDSFFLVDDQGTQQTTATITSWSVTDFNNVDRTNDFILETNYGGTTGQFRYGISSSSNFIFNHNAQDAQQFTFTVNTLFDNNTNQFTFLGRLANIAPSITPACNSLSVVTQQSNSNTIVTMNGVNGSYSNSTSDLFFEIDPTTNTQGYFILTNNNNQGLITINQNNPNGLPPLGVYNLTIKLTDAWDYTNNAPTGVINQGDFDSKRVECTGQGQNLDITIGAEAVPPCIQDDYGGVQQDLFFGTVYNNIGDGNGGCYNVNSAGYTANQQSGFTVAAGGTNWPYKVACLYIGRDDILNSNAIYSGNPYPLNGSWDEDNAENTNLTSLGLPSYPAYGTNFSAGSKAMDVIHLEKQLNGTSCDLTGGGLTSGALLFEQKVIADGAMVDSTQAQKTIDGKLGFIIYRRDVSNYTPNPNDWQLDAVTMNGEGSTSWKASTNTGQANAFLQTASQIDAGAGATEYGESMNRFVIDGTENPGEYCIYYLLQENTACDSNTGCAGQFESSAAMSVNVWDLHYTYPTGTGGDPKDWFGPNNSVYGFSAPYYTGMVAVPGTPTPFDNTPVGIEFNQFATSPTTLGFPIGSNTTDFRTTISTQSTSIVTMGTVLNQMSIGQAITLPNSASPSTIIDYVSAVNVSGDAAKFSTANAYTFTPGDVIQLGTNTAAGNYPITVQDFAFDTSGSPPSFSPNLGILYSNVGWVEGLRLLYYDTDLTIPFQPQRPNSNYLLKGGFGPGITSNDGKWNNVSSSNFICNKGYHNLQTPQNYFDPTQMANYYWSTVHIGAGGRVEADSSTGWFTRPRLIWGSTNTGISRPLYMYSN